MERALNILTLADVENKSIWDFYEKGKLEGYDLIISCGDLSPSYLEFLVSMTNLPLLYVRGNHDGVYDRKPPLGCIPIDDDIYDFKGLRIMGLGGSMDYHSGHDMYTEKEMVRRFNKVLPKAVIMGGVDILVTHAPAKGYGDLDDLPHQGFECFNDICRRLKPKYMLHGHVHKEYGHFVRERLHESGTRIINCYDKFDLKVKPDEYPPEGQTGSAMYDIYVRMKSVMKNIG